MTDNWIEHPVGIGGVTGSACIDRLHSGLHSRTVPREGTALGGDHARVAVMEGRDA